MSVSTIQKQKIMIRNKDFALPYAGRAVFNRNGGYAGAVVGRNDMHGGMNLVGTGDGLENVSSKI